LSLFFLDLGLWLGETEFGKRPDSQAAAAIILGAVAMAAFTPCVITLALPKAKAEKKMSE